MKVYVTKYALSEGIYVAEVHRWTDGQKEVSGNHVYECGDSGSITRTYVLGKDAFEVKSDAERKAVHMAQGKVATLLKALAKLQPLQEVPKWRPVAKERP